MQIQWKGSPNFDNNRTTIDRIIIHWFGEGTLESANSRFQNSTSKVSAHYGISDDKVYQWVKEENVAYHSGNYPMNQRSIGIEHDSTPAYKASNTTYKTSVELVKAICQRYNIPIDRQHIIGHNEVVATQCPGTMDIERIIREANTTTPDPLSICNQRLGELQADADRKQGVIEDRDNEIIRLKGEKLTLQEQLDTSQEALSVAQAASGSLEGQLVTLRLALSKEIDDYKTALDDSAADIKQLQEEKATLQIKVDTFWDSFSYKVCFAKGFEKLFTFLRGR